MIRLDRATLHAGVPNRRRAVLDGATFSLAPGIWHLSAEPASDARLLLDVFAGERPLDGGEITRDGRCSWPLAQFAALGPALTGLDLIDTVCALYDLERRGTFHFFRHLLDEPDWLGRRFDRWPAAAQRQFGHALFLAPAFDIYLLDVTPVLPDGEFYRRWRVLFRVRAAGKLVVIAAGEHRAAQRDFPGHRLRLAGGVLYRVPEPEPLPLLAAE